jgi:uncharacterized protein (TIGR03083 family)
VHDQFSHVIAVEADLAEQPLPDHQPDWSALPHVRHEIGQFLEIGVDYRRDRSPDEIRQELADIILTRAATIDALPADPDADVRGVAGMASVAARFGAVRAFDVWAHEQDVRRATDNPGRLSCPAAQLALNRIAFAAPYIVAKSAKAQPGESVRFLVGAPQDVRIDVAVDDESRGVLVDDLHAPTATIAADFATWVLMACGRAAPDALPVEVSGDTELAARVLANAAVTP